MHYWFETYVEEKCKYTRLVSHQMSEKYYFWSMEIHPIQNLDQVIL